MSERQSKRGCMDVLMVIVVMIVVITAIVMATGAIAKKDHEKAPGSKKGGTHAGQLTQPERGAERHLMGASVLTYGRE